MCRSVAYLQRPVPSKLVLEYTNHTCFFCGVNVAGIVNESVLHLVRGRPTGGRYVVDVRIPKVKNIICLVMSAGGE